MVIPRVLFDSICRNHAVLIYARTTTPLACITRGNFPPVISRNHRGKVSASDRREDYPPTAKNAFQLSHIEKSTQYKALQPSLGALG
jgi:hypothetical protein